MDNMLHKVQTDNKATSWLCGKPDAIFHTYTEYAQMKNKMNMLTLSNIFL